MLFSLVQVLAALRSVDKAAAAEAAEARTDTVDSQVAENQLAHIVEAHQAVHTAVVHRMGTRTADQVGRLAADIGVDRCALSDHTHTGCRTVASLVGAPCRSP